MGKSVSKKRVLYIISLLFFVIILPLLTILFYQKLNYQIREIINKFFNYFFANQGLLHVILLAFVALLRKKIRKVNIEILKGIALFAIVNLILNMLFKKVPNRHIVLKYLQLIIPPLYYYYHETISAFVMKLLSPVFGFISKILKGAVKGIWKVLKSAGGFTVEKVLKPSFEKMKQTKNIKNKRKKGAIAAVVVIAFVIGFYVWNYIDKKFFINVLDISPKGEVERSVVIRAEFSHNVNIKEASKGSAELMEIVPPIKGTYTLENRKVLEFHPDTMLPPAAEYTVKVNTQHFEALGKKIMSSGKTKFNTELPKITGYRFFFTKDIVKNIEKELMGEITFNYPVNGEELKKSIEITQIIKTSRGTSKETPVKFELEESEVPERFYIKVSGITRTYDSQHMQIKINKGIKCAECINGMADDFVQTVNVPDKIWLSVENVISWHDEGVTSAALLFNMPVSESQIKKYVTIIKEGSFGKAPEVINYDVKTEYRYAMFEADFMPNVKYEFVVSKEITAKTGEHMASDSKRELRIKDMASTFRFAEEGELLTTNGDMNIALRVMNLDKINVKVNKVFRNNLVHYLRNGNLYDLGKSVLDKTVYMQGGTINKEMTEFINMKNLNDQEYKGLFYIEIRDPKSYWGNVQRKLVRCTDIGMFAKDVKGDLHVKTVSIKNLTPMSNITVKLISRTNQTIKTMTTNSEGKVVFKNWNGKHTYDFSPFIILAEKGEDFSYLKLSDNVLNHYRFDTGGEPNENYELKGFLTSDRGLYRPGEKVFLTAIVRNKDVSVPVPIFVNCKISSPAGGYFYEKKLRLNRSGMAVFEIDIPLSAQTGQYSAYLSFGDSSNNEHNIANTSFKIEEFIPDKLKVRIKADKTQLAPGDPLRFKVQANQMFGPPAQGNKVRTEVRFVELNFTASKYKGYTFRDPERSYSSKQEDLGSDKLNGIGEYNYEVKIPSQVKPPSALQAEIFTEVYDDGGRPVGAYKSVPIHLYNYYLGAKISDDRKVYKRGDKVTLDVVAIDSEQTPQKLKDIQVVVKRKVWYSIFRTNNWNRNSHSSSYYSEVIMNKTIDIDGKTELTFDADKEGEYYIYVGNEQMMRTGIVVNVSGPGFTTYDMTKADKVDIIPDKSDYLPGDRARIMIKAPFDGMLYFTVEREDMFIEKYVPVVNRQAVVEFSVKDEYLPNVYVSAIVVRKPDEELMSMPFVAYSVKNISVDKQSKNLKPKMTVKDEVMSTEGINVKVNTGRADTAVVLVAVDEGILQIIRFETPDPLEHFYQKKRLDVRSYTIFNKVLTDIKATKLAIGGGYYEPMRKHLNPVIAKRVESYAKFSGILYTDENGEVEYNFKTDKFNGKVRVMAICVNKERFGSTEKYTNIVDPIVITPNLPRFLALGDEFYMPVRIYNNTGKEGTFTATLELDGPVDIEKDTRNDLKIENKKETKILFKGKAKNEAGKAVFKVVVSGNGQKMNVQRELAVRPAAHLQTDLYRGVLEPGAEFAHLIPSDYIKYGKNVRLFLSKNKVAQYAASLDYLVRYPYGCIEQTTSSAFPMLYFRDLELTEWLVRGQAANVDTYINEAIKKIRKFMLPGGRLTFWPGSTSEAPKWIELYVSHFLIEAKRLGYYVPDDLYRDVLRNIGISADSSVRIQRNEGRLDRRGHNTEYNYTEYHNNMYLLYLKALVEKADIEKMDYMESLYALYLKRDKKNAKLLKEMGIDLEKNKLLANTEDKKALVKGGLIYNNATSFVEGMNETDQFLLSMAFSAVNNTDAGKMVLYEDFKSKFMIRELGGMFNSYARNLGMYLKAVAQAEQKETLRGTMTEDLLLKKLRNNGTFGNTHETAWALMGLGAMNQIEERKGTMETDFYKNGILFGTITGGKSRVFSDLKNNWTDVKLVNKGEKKVYYNLLVEGTPKEKNKKAVSEGLKVTREYYDENGRKVNLTNVVQGKLMVVSVVVENLTKRNLENVVVVDMLPAGFEIENPRLQSRGSLNFNPVYNFNSVYQDIRDDRILLFPAAFSGRITYSYSVRAVTPGKFVIPNIYAEAMYDPDIHGENFEEDYLIVVPEKL